jgi:chitosanase
LRNALDVACSAPTPPFGEGLINRRLDLSRRRSAILVAVTLLLVGVVTLVLVNRSAGPTSGEGTESGSSADGGRQSVDPRDPRLALTADAQRKDRAAQITSTFENATLELQYDYAENIGDGRGITAGRAGFTSATGDLLRLVRGYTEMKPDNPLAPYIPALEAVEGTDSEAGLEGFIDAWAEAAADPDQRRLQDDLVDELYFTPAMTLADEVGLDTPLGQAIMWDTMIQHGAGGENGTRVIIEETQDTVGTPDGDEAAWLDAFLDARLHHLGHAYENTTEDADASSRSRIDALRSLLADGNLALEAPLTWKVYGSTYTLRS